MKTFILIAIIIILIAVIVFLIRELLNSYLVGKKKTLLAEIDVINDKIITLKNQYSNLVKQRTELENEGRENFNSDIGKSVAADLEN